MQTFVGSILIIVAAAVIYFTGFFAIDPILGMVFGIVLLLASWGIIRDSLFILMEGAPRGVDLMKVARALDQLSHVTSTHHIHAWTLTSNKHVFSAHLKVDAAKNAASCSFTPGSVHARRVAANGPIDSVSPSSVYGPLKPLQPPLPVALPSSANAIHEMPSTSTGAPSTALSSQAVPASDDAVVSADVVSGTVSEPVAAVWASPSSSSPHATTNRATADTSRIFRTAADYAESTPQRMHTAVVGARSVPAGLPEPRLEPPPAAQPALEQPDRVSGVAGQARRQPT